jgi:hypothetical protein
MVVERWGSHACLALVYDGLLIRCLAFEVSRFWRLLGIKIAFEQNRKIT